MRCAIYVRVSREEQLEGWSLEAQKEQCIGLASFRNWPVVRIYEEPGRSAKTDARPAFQRLMSHAQSGQFDLILVHKLDRFSRSLADVVKNVAYLKEAKVGLVSVSEPWLDTTTPQGEFMLYLFALLAQWDNQNRGMEMSKGKRARAMAGYWNGTLCFGYTTSGLLKAELLDLDRQFERGELPQGQYENQIDELESYLVRWNDRTEGDAIPHPVNAAGVLLAYNQYSLGTFSDRDVCHILNEEGYRTTAGRLFTPDTMMPLLQNRFYLGEATYKGKSYPGRHPALIPRELFEKCQQVRARRRVRPTRGTATQRVYPLSRLALCACCEKPMRGQANHSGLRYYRNPISSIGDCQQGMVRADEAEAAVLRCLSQIRLPQDWRDRIADLSHTAEDVAGKRARLTHKRERLVELYLEGSISREKYDQRLSDIDGKIIALTPPPEPELEAAGELLEDIGGLLEQATPEELKSILHALLDTVYLDRHKVGHPVVAIEPKPFAKLLMDISLGGVENLGVVPSEKYAILPKSKTDAGDEELLSVPSATPVVPVLIVSVINGADEYKSVPFLFDFHRLIKPNYNPCCTRDQS